MRKLYVLLALLLICSLLSSCRINKAADNGADGNQPDQPKATDSEDATYAIYVNDTINVESEGLITKFKLVLFATTSGSDQLNTYSANIALDYGLDADQLTGLGGAPIVGMGGFNVSQHAENVVFDLVSLNIDSYARYGTDIKDDEYAPLPLTIIGDSMALLTPEMNGTGQLGISITGAIDTAGGIATAESGDSSTNASGPLVMKMTIKNGMVTIDIPSLNQAMAGQRFEGIVTKSSDIIKQAETIANGEFSKMQTPTE